MINKKKIKRDSRNIYGWSTNRKLIVIESDDWGSLRIPSLKALEEIKNSELFDPASVLSHYNNNDSLASPEDLNTLYKSLEGIRDKNNNPAVFTVLCNVANPDFEKIRVNNFSKYYYEDIRNSLKKFRASKDSFEKWLLGINKGIFIPQMHGREHLNVSAWMHSLQNKNPQSRFEFDLMTWSVKSKNENDPYFQEAYDLSNETDLNLHRDIIKDGLCLFEEIFGYRARYFVPPNGVINNSLNKTLYKYGIEYRSTGRIQKEVVGKNKYNTKIHWLGKKDRSGITYITRNCFFEPSISGKDWVDSCLLDISSAFRFNKPAIISTHRVNYIGVHNPTNRENGNIELRKLLSAIIKRWPDSEFITTTQLGDLITQKTK